MSSVSPNGHPVHPAHSSSNPGPILSHVRAIRKAHERLVGKTLSWEEAISRLDRFNAAQDDPTFPVKTRDVVIGCWLTGESYSPEAIHRVLTHCAIFQTASDCPDLDRSDAEAVEELMAAEAHLFLGL